MSPAERDKVWAAMRVPAFATIALLCFLAGLLAVAQFAPSRTLSFIEAGIVLCMVVTVLLFTMDVRLEAPLMRFYALLGFAWLTILLAMTMLDYWTR